MRHNVGWSARGSPRRRTSGSVGVQVAHPDVPLIGRGDGPEIDLGEVDGSDRRSKVEVPRQGASDLLSDGPLSLFGRSSDMRGQDRVGAFPQPGDEISEVIVEPWSVRAGFRREDVDGASGQVTRFEGVDECGEVDDFSPRVVDQVSSLFHLTQFGGPDHVPRLFQLGDVQGDEIRGAQELFERIGLPGRSEGHDGQDVVVDDLHPKGFRQDAQLTTDMSIPDDPQRLAPDLPTALGDLVPDPFTHLAGPVTELTREGDDLADDEFGDGTRVGKGRVEDGDPGLCGGLEVDLVGPDAETSDRQELRGAGHGKARRGDRMSARRGATGVCDYCLPASTHLRSRLDDPFRDLCLAPDPQRLIPAQPLYQLVLSVCFGDEIDVIPLIPEVLGRVLRNVLQEQDPDLTGLFALGRRRGGGRRDVDVAREESVEETSGRGRRSTRSTGTGRSREVHVVRELWGRSGEDELGIVVVG